jgi:hypothetical protein
LIKISEQALQYYKIEEFCCCDLLLALSVVNIGVLPLVFDVYGNWLVPFPWKLQDLIDHEAIIVD